ncbi:MAG: hypothetical protein R2867_09620 [Caldilineaceae bacterium]
MRRRKNELLWLSQSPNWQTVGLLWRVLLLRYLLQGDGNELQHWLAQTPPLPANLLGIALGILASFGHSLTVEHLHVAATVANCRPTPRSPNFAATPRLSGRHVAHAIAPTRF